MSTKIQHAVPPVVYARRASAGCCLAMACIGALMASYGPLIPEFGERFGAAGAQAGFPLAIQSAGSVVGAVVTQRIVFAYGYRRGLAGSFVLIAAGALLVGSVASWPALLAGALIAGLGLGVCDTSVSQSFIVAHGRRGPAMVNLAHGCFGIGTVAGPALVAVVGSDRYQLVFCTIAVLVLCAGAGLGGIPRRFGMGGSGAGGATPAPNGSRLDRRGLYIVAAFLVLYIAHFGVQSGIGSWEPTRLADQGVDATVATLATSGYWLAMVVGRFIAIPLSSRLRPSVIVIGSCSGMTAALLIAVAVPSSALWAYPLAGLFIGPIFPNGLTWLLTSGYARGSVFGYVVAGALAGSIVLPPLLGQIIANHGTSSLAPTLLVVACLSVVAALSVAGLTASRPATKR
ncbi:MFS transporter [Gordonia sp. DT219]|uniref:MFS transporter n=1 Tax=Gordonia sp. DT219 TaxID=3416658 RepID=UPI003CEB907C